MHFIDVEGEIQASRQRHEEAQRELASFRLAQEFGMVRGPRQLLTPFDAAIMRLAAGAERRQSRRRAEQHDRVEAGDVRAARTS